MERSVLIIDDTETFRRRLTRVLEATGLFARILTADDGITGFKLMLSQRVDLVVCDLVMPGMDGYKFVSLVQRTPRFAEVPVILLTGEEHVRSKVRGLDAGASDYLTKPFYDDELVARVRVHLKLKALQDELREKNLRLEELSRTDGLTGLSNRRHFFGVLQQELLRAERYSLPLVFAMLDVDHFKKVNDEYGHLVGDEALVAVSKIILQTIRVQDVAGRYGGEEFAVVMPHTEHGGAFQAIERCRERIERMTITAESGIQLSVTASAGLACYPHDIVHGVQDLVRLADSALYAAKERGRNRVITAA